MKKTHVDFADTVAAFVENLVETQDRISEDERKNVDQIVGAIRELIHGVAEDNEDRVFKSLDVIQDVSLRVHSELFKEVGKLTRKLHDSINDFQKDIGPQLAHMAANDVPEAANQLQSVITMTDDAAHTVLELAEYQNQLLDEQKQAIALLSTDSAQDQNAPIARIVECNTRISGATNEIVMAQGFQDLSGQVLKRVITLISDVQNSLVDLVRMFGVVEQAAICSAPVSQVAQAAENAKSSCNQDDIDSLLGSFGF